MPKATSFPSRKLNTVRNSSLITLGGIALAAILAAPSAAAPPAYITFAVGGADPKSDEIVPIPLPNGNAKYVATYGSPDNQWKVTYNLTIDFTSNPQAMITGTIETQNLSGVSLPFFASLDIPVCPLVESGSFVGGAVSITLTANGPSLLNCVGTTPWVQVCGDGENLQSLFSCPATLGSSGSGVMSSNGNFGLPGPSQVGPQTLGTIGERISYNLSSYDTASVWVSLLFKASSYVTPTCVADIDDDGNVGASDLAALFQHWGETGFCSADLPGDVDGDGIVGAPDVVNLLAAWGRCN